MSETTPNLPPEEAEPDDQDAGPATTPEEVDRLDERDQAEGEDE